MIGELSGEHEMKKLILIILLALVSTGALADISKSIASCADKQGELERLQCYDDLAKANNLAGPIQNPNKIEGIGKWRISDSINPIDDSRTVALVLQADSGINSWGNSVSLVIRCQSNKTALFIKWNEFLGSDVEVLTRVGSAKAVTRMWSLSSDSQSSFYRDNPIFFTKSLFEADKFVAQTTPYNENPLTAIFDIRGLQKAAAPLIETCNWPSDEQLERTKQARLVKLKKEEAKRKELAEKVAAERKELAEKEAKERQIRAAQRIEFADNQRCIMAMQRVTDLKGVGLEGTAQYKEAQNKVTEVCRS